jgi:hypothetical protein
VVSDTQRLALAESARVAKVLQKQLTRDMRPAWGRTARVEAFARLEDVPLGHWPLIVRDQIEGNVASYHGDKNGQPYALVAYADNWSKLASHSLLEMVTNPLSTRLAKGPSPVSGQKYDVHYLVQICDPCSAGEYRIDDVLVADFSLPAFWTRSRRSASKYSFTGLLRRPFQIARGGYVSWRDPKTNHWYQKGWWNARAEVRDLGVIEDLGDEDSSQEPGRVGSPHKTIRFRLTALMDVYRVQESQLGSARAVVESLIQRFA